MAETPAELCDRAARYLDYIAHRATPGPWSASLVDSPDSHCTSAVYDHSPGSKPGDEVVGSSTAKPRKRDGTVIGPANRDGGIWRPQDAEWIAVMSPAVAVPLAAILRAAAGEWRTLQHFPGSTVGVPDPALLLAHAVLDHVPAARLRFAGCLPPEPVAVSRG